MSTTVGFLVFSNDVLGVTTTAHPAASVSSRFACIRLNCARKKEEYSHNELTISLFTLEHAEALAAAALEAVALLTPAQEVAA
jgi:hypothetical protein